jgi:hypothetical protein
VPAGVVADEDLPGAPRGECLIGRIEESLEDVAIGVGELQQKRLARV